MYPSYLIWTGEEKKTLQQLWEDCQEADSYEAHRFFDNFKGFIKAVEEHGHEIINFFYKQITAPYEDPFRDA